MFDSAYQPTEAVLRVETGGHVGVGTAPFGQVLCHLWLHQEATVQSSPTEGQWSRQQETPGSSWTLPHLFFCLLCAGLRLRSEGKRFLITGGTSSFRSIPLIDCARLQRLSWRR